MRSFSPILIVVVMAASSICCHAFSHACKRKLSVMPSIHQQRGRMSFQANAETGRTQQYFPQSGALGSALDTSSFGRDGEVCTGGNMPLPSRRMKFRPRMASFPFLPLPSFGLVPNLRRLLFLLFATVFVQTFRTEVLKLSKYHLKAADRCPWPFIFSHDPKQGFKDNQTWVVIVWVCMCQLYSFAVKARAVSV